LQVSSHLNACLNIVECPIFTDEIAADGEQKAKAKGKGKEVDIPAKRIPLVSVAAIVGGMSAQKQRRILDRGVDILVATPGRLWDILEDASHTFV
jgi:ATP-dependent RNA helicase DDX24/MAK5